MHLADLASCSEAYPKGTDDVSRFVRNAHKLVLPTDTLHLVQYMRSQMPREINHLRRQARPPFPLMFVEADLMEYNRSMGMEPQPDQEGAVTGLLIVDEPDKQAFLCHVIDTTGALRPNCKVLNWPLRFGVSYADGGFYKVPDDIPEKVEQLLWGYGTDIDVGALHRTAWAEPDSRVPMEVGVAALRETQGVLRYACAILALLNGPAELHDGARTHKDRIYVLGRTRKTTVPSIIRVDVPKRVKDPGAYVLKLAREGTRKRLHDVRGHYRFTKRQPLTAHGAGSRWEPWGDGWRCWIDNHVRGDESLGDLRGRTLVPVVPHVEHNL
jgi:hypothetical protein